MDKQKGAINLQEDRIESAKNPLVPGARILRRENASRRYVPNTASMQWFYPLSEINDLAMFTYIEKKAHTDTDRPWAAQANPDVNQYIYILDGAGTIIFGVGDDTFKQESYRFTEQELVIIPRGISYKLTGEWNGVWFHARTSVYGTVAGTNRFPHPIITMEKPPRPTQEETEALQEPGTYICMDPLYTCGVKGTYSFEKTITLKDFSENGNESTQDDQSASANDLYEAVTPIDQQTKDDKNLLEAKKNASVLGARVIKYADVPSQYNANAGLKQRCLPLTWSDDIAICNLAEKNAASDMDRPFDSHAHPDIEEYKYILSGSGTVTIGIGDETCEVETYEFKAGDLVILPRGLAHLDSGGYTALYFHTKQSVFGKTPGTSLYPHNAYVYTKPPRPTKEEEEALNDPGTYLLMNSRETYAIHLPNPILKTEPLAQEMKHLRPDLFSGDKS